MSDLTKTEASSTIHAEVGDSYISAGLAHDDRPEKSKAEKRLVLKQDLLITTLMSGAFFFAYLDRGAIGNARLLGFQKDMGIDNTQYYNCLVMFYIGYFVFEFPALLLIRKFHAPTVYGIGVLIFGAAGIGTAYATTYGQILALRLVLGAGEAVVQTSFVFLSLWYTRRELTSRAGYVYSTTPVAGAVSGIIAYFVGVHMEGKKGLASWQWLFLIEGIPTMVWGVLMWCLLPRLPENEVKNKYSIFFRSEEERRLIVQRSTAAQNTLDTGIRLWQVLAAFKDPKTWMMAYIVASIGMALAAFGVFLPTFIKEFGFPRLTTQLYTIIPYGVAFLNLLFVSQLVDRFGKRALPLLILVGVAIVGFILLMATTNKVALFFGAVLINAAVYPCIVISAAWVPSNNAGYTKRSTAAAMMQTFIQLFSIISTQVYTTPPRFLKGHGVGLAFLVLCFLDILGVVYLMKRSNAKKDAEAIRWRDLGETNPDESKSLEEMCDAHPNYRYVW